MQLEVLSGYSLGTLIPGLGWFPEVFSEGSDAYLVLKLIELLTTIDVERKGSKLAQHGQQYTMQWAFNTNWNPEANSQDR